MAKTISITSGKGGVGKTSLTANLGLRLAQEGKRVLLLDGDLGMSNLDIMLGVRPVGHLGDVLSGQKSVAEILTQVNPNLSFISGGSGLVELNRLTHFERRSLVDAVSGLDHQFDYLLIDTAPGISDNVLHLNSAAQVAMVLINPDPSSLTDSYALIKVLNQEYRESHFAVVCNQVKDEEDGALLFQKFSEVAHRFLNLSLDYWGSIPQDQAFKRATQQQRLIMRHEPQAPATQAIIRIAENLQSSVQRMRPKSGLQFFWEQVVGVA